MYPTSSDRWTRAEIERLGAGLVLAIAALLAVLAFAIFLFSPQRLASLRGDNLPWWINAIQIVLAGPMALLLLRGGRNDTRAVALGGFFAVMAGAYGQRYLRHLEAAGWPDSLLAAVGELEIGVFLAYFLLRFVTQFPDAHPSFRFARLNRIGERAALGVGWIFLLASVPAALVRLWPGRQPLTMLTAWWVGGLGALGWSLVALLLMLAAAILIHKSRRSTGEELRRGRLFLVALLITCGPVMVNLLLFTAVPAYDAYFDAHPIFRRWNLVSNNLLIALLPMTTAYAVLVQRVLDVRLIARRALQHALAKSSVHLLLWTPLALAVAVLYQQRYRPLVEILRGLPLLALLSLGTVGMLAVMHRGRVLDAVDRHFFRERYNARRVLAQLAEQVQGCRNRLELANLVGRGCDLALGIDRATLMIEDPGLGQWVDPRGEARSLDPAGRLATLIQGNREPLDLGQLGFSTATLPEAEVHWLVDGQAHMVLPLFALDGALLGLLALSGRRNELPFLLEDRQLLVEVGSAVALVVEMLRLKERSSAPPAHFGGGEESGLVDFGGEHPEAMTSARECLGCGRVHPSDWTHCRRCEFELADASVPFILRRVFRFERRIGHGGMAVVYRATDLKLGRRVAIKTLPRVSADAALRLHHEARAASAVVHPGLAAIFGLETWEGTPLLIQEYLDGGTLADRLRAGPLETREVILAGQTVALALYRIHSLGILHRDVKPSNIGFTLEGDAKLLDFGIAHLREDLRTHPNVGGAGERGEEPSAWEATAWLAIETPRGEIAGTLTYLSPEAISGADPHPTFDLWSLCVVLYEALVGENLFLGRVDNVLDAIRQARVPDLRQRIAQCPEILARFFDRELAQDRSRRSQNGKELHRRLRAVEQALTLSAEEP